MTTHRHLDTVTIIPLPPSTVAVSALCIDSQWAFDGEAISTEIVTAALASG